MLDALVHVYFFLLYGPRHPRHIHSFPTRRSSDLFQLRDRRVPVRGPSLTKRNAALPAHGPAVRGLAAPRFAWSDRKSTRLNSSHRCISYAVFCLKKKNIALLEYAIDRQQMLT